MARASIAAQRRRARSSSTGSRLVYFVLMVWTVTFRMQTILPIEGENWISYSGETPYSDQAPRPLGGSGGRPLSLRVRGPRLPQGAGRRTPRRGVQLPGTTAAVSDQDCAAPAARAGQVPDRQGARLQDDPPAGRDGRRIRLSPECVPANLSHDRAPQEAGHRPGADAAVRGVPRLLLHHQRPHAVDGGGRVFGQ